MATANISELINKDLNGFTIIKMTEVYLVDEDGRMYDSLGYFRNQDVAEAFAESQKDADRHKTRQALVLTNGIIGYTIEDQTSVSLFDDDAEKKKIRDEAVAKLGTATRKVLGLGN